MKEESARRIDFFTGSDLGSVEVAPSSPILT
jgi:hypothetical protein